EVHATGTDDVEELQADRGDAAEVAGTRVALHAPRGPLHVDPGLVPLRVELAGGGREQHVDALLRRDRDVGRLVARVAAEVGLVVELRRVDEEAGDHRVALGAGGTEQCDVAGVVGAHRRDEADAGRALERRARLRDHARDPHGAVASASTRYIGSSSGWASCSAPMWASTTDQSPREIGPVSSKPFSIVRVISGTSASGGAPASSNSRAAVR